MLNRHTEALAEINKKIGELAKEFQERIAIGELKGEEDITSRLIERLAGVLTRSEPGFTLQSKAITIDKYKEEPTIGADILIVTSYASKQINISKGFLVQAKNLNQGKNLSTQEMNSLRKQCGAMLKESVESYVWCYSKGSIRVQKAYTVEKLRTNRPDDVFYTYFRPFMNSFLKCHHGDPSLDLTAFPRLKRVVESLKIPNVLMIKGQSGDGTAPRGGGTPPPDSPLPDLDDLAQQLDGREIEADIRGEVPVERRFLRVTSDLETYRASETQERVEPKRIQLWNE